MYKTRGTGLKNFSKVGAAASVTYAERDKKAASKVLSRLTAKLQSPALLSATPVIEVCDE